MGDFEVRWVQVPTDWGPRRVPVLGLIDGEYLLASDADALFDEDCVAGPWELVSGARMAELQRLRLAPRSAETTTIIHKENLARFRGTPAYAALWQAPREVPTPSRSTEPLAPAQLKLLDLWILTRALHFTEVAGNRDVAGIIKRDVLRRFRVSAVEELRASDANAIWDFVAGWTKQLAPLSKKQQAHGAKLWIAKPQRPEVRGCERLYADDPKLEELF